MNKIIQGATIAVAGAETALGMKQKQNLFVQEKSQLAILK